MRERGVNFRVIKEVGADMAGDVERQFPRPVKIHICLKLIHSGDPHIMNGNNALRVQFTFELRDKRQEFVVFGQRQGFHNLKLLFLDNAMIVRDLHTILSKFALRRSIQDAAMK